MSSIDQNQKFSDIRYRLYLPGDVDAINRFYNDPAERPGAAAQNYIPRTDAQWKWEFDPHNTGSPPYALAHHEERLVGIQAFIQVEMIRNGVPIATEKSEDTLVSPFYRKRGILNEMYRILFEKAKSNAVDVQWGFTDIPRAFYQSGYKNLATVRALKAELNPVASLRSRINKLGSDKLSLRNLAFNLLKAPRLLWSYFRGTLKRSKPFPLSGDIIIEDSDLPTHECESLSLAFSKRYGGISPHLTPAYLKWRCFDNPNYKYKIFASRSGKNLNGLAVFKLDQPALIALLSIVIALPTETDSVDLVVNALLKEGFDYLKRMKYKYILAWKGASHPFSRILNDALNRFGFMETGDGIDFIARKVCADDPAYLHPDEWFLCEIMSER